MQTKTPQCPYYRKEGERFIECEALTDFSERTKIVFADRHKKKLHRDCFCAKMKDEGCTIRRALDQKLNK